MSILEAVSALYEAQPYPPVGRFRSLFQGLRKNKGTLLNYTEGYVASFGGLEGAAERPRILIAGCGTFEPVVVAQANPKAEILAVDLSARSLKELQWQLKWRGLAGRVQTLQGDFEKISVEQPFDFVIATGVIHHLEDPARGLRKLMDLSAKRAVFRFMVYSQWGRSLLYQTKDLAQRLGIKDPKAFRRMIAALPANHPYKIYFHLYSDSKTDAGLCDGYLHPQDQAFTALELESLLKNVGLEAGKFLLRPEGQPAAALALSSKAEHLSDWQKLALLEAYGALEENFIFLARKVNHAQN
ncbi:MAG: class I SAM-dependent methyltransferase [Bdellovibrionota bacterium]